MFNTPILFIVFNRPDTTKKVFEAIRNVRPKELFVAADGPRKNIAGDSELCEEVRKIATTIDWDCKLTTLFRDKNLGCGVGPSEAITWFFENVEEGIILEDDVLPTQSFFHFCKEMLTKFKEDLQIMHVSGNNFELSEIGLDCYYLSKIPHSWGWATWRRAWEKFDFKLVNFKDDQICNYFKHPSIDNYWHNIFRLTKKEWHEHVWDYQWIFAIFHNNGLSVIPQRNLVSNIGFGEDSTHTSDTQNYLANLKRYEMDIKLDNTTLTYDPNSDINFHKVFRLEIVENSLNITAKEAIKILFAKTKNKIFKKI